MKFEFALPLPKTSREIVVRYTRASGLGVRLDG